MTAGTAPRVGGEVASALRDATGGLDDAGCESPRLDAELLLAHALGTDRASLVVGSRRTLGEAEARRFAALLARRALREPVAYIVGLKGFRHLDLRVDARALIPRPETETLVEAALDLPHGARVVDVGTGSGAVALAVKQERPDLHVTGTDRSGDALALAQENAARLGLQVDLRRADLLDGAGGSFDAVLANLPYVAEADWPALAPEITGFEPRGALVAGEDGLQAIRRLAAQAVGAAFVALEVGAGQAAAVGPLLREHGFEEVETRTDLAGIERVVVARTR